jgi:HSP20 family molecular chaperone IbpA
MPGLQKQDVHVSFQRNRLVVTWENVNITEREEDGRVVRERREKTYNRTIPLPEGTKVSSIYMLTAIPRVSLDFVVPFAV